MPKQEFDIKLEKPQGVGTWTFFVAPFKVEKVFGSKARVKVKGTINGVLFRSSLFPRGDGTHYMVVNKSLREKTCIGPGDSVHITLEIDTEERVVQVPENFEKALKENKIAKAAFEKSSYTHKKEYVEWIEDAKQEETRKRRIEKAISKLAGGTRAK